MIKVIIAYDDNDEELGDYFEISYNDINDFLSNVANIEVIPIRGLNCTESNVIDAIEDLEDEHFVFVGLSHGMETQLLTSNEVYVDISSLNHFSNSLFYTTACSTAKELGNELISNGCLSFIGFINDSYATYENYYHIYTECENYCLKEFLSSNNTIEESFDNMIELFDNKINELFEQHEDEILVGMELVGNRDQLRIIGDKSLKKANLDND